MDYFQQRTNTANKFAEIMKKNYWNTKQIKDTKIYLHEYGYENFLDEAMLNDLRTRRSSTAKFIRYAPDYILCSEDREILLEYKVTKTPRYTYRDLQWDRGQIEADAFDNYLNLCALNIEVVILLYCPYHSYPILCGKPSIEWILGERQRTYQSSGSGTEFYNIDLIKMMHFDLFMEETFHISKMNSQELIERMLEEMKHDDDLKTEHAENSNYNDGKYETGFNWIIN